MDGFTHPTGCLVDFIYTIGTPWEPDLTGTIFFFEDCNSAPIRIDRALHYLEQVGKLEGVRGSRRRACGL
jgi:muramoyltetrapeptide carboxypeptidase